MPPDEAPAAAEIDVGAAAGELRLWRAREAMRQGELSLKSQSESRDNLRAAATSLLGWTVTGVGVIAAAALTAAKAEWRVAAMLAVICLLGAAALCVVSLFPRRWAKAGYNPEQILSNGLGSELEITEALAQGVGGDIRTNRAQLIWTSIILRAAWFLVALAPTLGVTALTARGQTTLATLLGIVR